MRESPTSSPPRSIWSQSARMRGKRRYSTRSFFLVVGCGILLGLLSLLQSDERINTGPERGSWVRRETGHGIGAEAEECRLVWKADDQCAFIKTHCVDEAAGLLDYLHLYFCSLADAKAGAFIIIVLWLSFLFSAIGIAASDFFCVNLSTIASFLGLSESLAGVTFLAFGNGSPDVFSTFAAFNSHSGSLAIGELIGAAGFISAVVAGSMALVRPFRVARKSFVRDVSFFIVAASFSMVFLFDGELRIWECALMVGFYIFYVIFVVVWHWWFSRKRQHREIEAAARGHYVIPGTEEAEAHEEYFDDDEGETTRRQSISREVSGENVALLETGLAHVDEEESDEDLEDEERHRLLGQLADNMRLARPKGRSRRNTRNPIRPSLVGALEYSAVVDSLRRSGNVQDFQLSPRRHSLDPGRYAEFNDAASHTSDPGRSSHDMPRTTHGTPFSASAPRLARSSTGPHRPRAASAAAQPVAMSAGSSQPPLPLPKIEVEETHIEETSRSPSPLLGDTPSDSSPAGNQNLLDIPNEDSIAVVSPAPSAEAGSLPKMKASDAPRRSVPERPRLHKKNSSIIQFPNFTDQPSPIRSPSRPASIMLPTPIITPDPYDPRSGEDDRIRKPVRCWPGRFLPPPSVLAATFFPTLYGWRSKDIWEKMLGIVAAPSVFMLTVTLPVVEPTKDDDDGDVDENIGVTPIEGPTSNSRPKPGIRRSSSALPPDSPTGDDPSSQVPLLQTSSPSPDAAMQNGNAQTSSQPPRLPPIGADASVSLDPEVREWNRWLVILHTFTSPLFIVLIIWANTTADESDVRPLLESMAIALLCSIGALIFILFTTSPTRAPRWRPLICFLGFAVSISWISTIANEVVGVLKALGVILNMSDAILGLTLFAVGNSLGDLVADVTVARLGYPVMALSACFGGPMLNILLGVGVSGLYILIRGAKQSHARHPEKQIKWNRPYEVEVTTTLIVSGFTLLVTLVGLLVVVPLRRWKMDRFVGIGLILLWIASTITNIVIEAVGVRWKGISS